jgi:hypothetical protein
MGIRRGESTLLIVSSSLVFFRRTDNKALNSMQRRNICANRARTKNSYARNFWPMKISTKRVNAAVISDAFAGA